MEIIPAGKQKVVAVHKRPIAKESATKKLTHANLDSSYYTGGFPYTLLLDFLSLNTANFDTGYYRENLEIVVVMESMKTGVNWKRYNSWPDSSRFSTFAEKHNLQRVDIGSHGFSPSCFWRGQAAVVKTTLGENYTENHSSYLVLDIDLSDYDDVRTCSCKTDKGRSCKECTPSGNCECQWKGYTKICPICWNFATAAMIIIDFILRGYWGYSDFYFVFSGNKGLHCWILDPETERFTESERDRFVASFVPWTDQKTRIGILEETATRETKYNSQLYDLCEEVFEAIILQVDGIFSLTKNETNIALLDIFDLDSMEELVFNKFELLLKKLRSADGPSLWDGCKKFIDQNYPTDTAKTLKKKIVYHWCFPRLDHEVTRKIVHPKKAPFSLHPKTGRVCVPILPRTTKALLSFNPSHAPTDIDYTRIETAIGLLEEEIALSPFFLKEYRVCVKFKTIFTKPHVDHETENYEQEVAFVAGLVLDWLLSKFDRSMLLGPYTDHHTEHRKTCKDCPQYSFKERTDTVYHWIINNSWYPEGIYSTLLEKSFKLAWLRYFQIEYTEQELSERTKKYLLKYFK